MEHTPEKLDDTQRSPGHRPFTPRFLSKSVVLENHARENTPDIPLKPFLFFGIKRISIGIK